jgi:hypothetical protein
VLQGSRSQPVISDGGTRSGAIGANISELGIVASGTGATPYASQGTRPFGTLRMRRAD